MQLSRLQGHHRHHITTEGDNLTVNVQDSQGCHHQQVQVPAAAARAARPPRRAVRAGAGGAQLGGLRGGEEAAYYKV